MWGTLIKLDNRLDHFDIPKNMFFFVAYVTVWVFGWVLFNLLLLLSFPILIIQQKLFTFYFMRTFEKFRIYWHFHRLFIKFLIELRAWVEHIRGMTTKHLSFLKIRIMVFFDFFCPMSVLFVWIMMVFDSVTSLTLSFEFLIWFKKSTIGKWERRIHFIPIFCWNNGCWMFHWNFASNRSVVHALFTSWFKWYQKSQTNFSQLYSYRSELNIKISS